VKTVPTKSQQQKQKQNAKAKAKAKAKKKKIGREKQRKSYTSHTCICTYTSGARGALDALFNKLFYLIFL